MIPISYTFIVQTKVSFIEGEEGAEEDEHDSEEEEDDETKYVPYEKELTIADYASQYASAYVIRNYYIALKNWYSL